jgi:nucleoside-diphosphate-sugar epimerase
VVVTGGSGRIGHWVCKALIEAGWHIYNLDMHRPEEWLGPHYQVDAANAAHVYDSLAQVRPEAVVHLAANPMPNGHPRHQIFSANTMATFNTLQAAGDLGVRRVVYGSSEMASGWSSAHLPPPQIPFAETDVTPPPNAYALSKLVGEVIADSVAAAHPEMSIVSLRINSVVMPDRYARIADAAKSGKMTSTLWSYIDVRDVASAVLAGLASPFTGHRAYMIAAADAALDVPTREAVRERYGPEMPILDHLPEFGSCVDCRRIEADLGWKPRHSWRDHIEDHKPKPG